MPRKYIPKPKPKPPVKTETQLSAEIKDALRKSPRVSCLFRVQSGMIRSGKAWIHCADKGTPDLIGYCIHGRMVAVEVKTVKGKATPEQERWRLLASSRNVICCIAHSAEEAVREVETRCIQICDRKPPPLP